MFNVNLEIGPPFLVRATNVGPITTSFVSGTVFSMDYHNSLGLEVDYVKGTETSMETRVQISNDAGVTYMQETAEAVSGGTITKSLAVRSYSVTGTFSELIRPLRAGLVRVQVSSTYGTLSTGSCRIRAFPLWS